MLDLVAISQLLEVKILARYNVGIASNIPLEIHVRHYSSRVLTTALKSTGLSRESIQAAVPSLTGFVRSVSDLRSGTNIILAAPEAVVRGRVFCVGVENLGDSTMSKQGSAHGS